MAGGFGSGWGYGPWGSGSLGRASESVDVGVLDDTLSVDDEVLALVSRLPIPRPVAGAVSPIRVQVDFRVSMSIDEAFEDPSKYTIIEAEGGLSIPVTSVTVTSDHTAVLDLAAPLRSKGYYVLVIDHSVVSFSGYPSDPDTVTFQWADMTRPVFGVPLEIPIGNFSGEVRGGILGEPDGLVFFTPAYESVIDTSTIEVEDVSVCTQAYDEYHLPAPPDPIPLMTFGGATPSLLGAGAVLWAPADRLGQAKLSLSTTQSDNLEAPYDSPAYAQLIETIDITKASFLNDTRWKTYPSTSALQFKTASNQSSIGAGPTVRRTLDWPKIELHDTVPIADSAEPNTYYVDLPLEGLVITDSCILEAFIPGLLSVILEEGVVLTDALYPSTDYRKVLSDAVSTSDTVSATKIRYVDLSTDALTVTDSTTLLTVFERSDSNNVGIADEALLETTFPQDTLSVTDSLTTSAEFGRTGSDLVLATDVLSLSSDYSYSVSDTLDITELVDIALGNVVDVDDNMSITDSTTAFLEKSRVASDSIILTDILSYDSFFGRTPSDSLSVTESLVTVNDPLSIVTSKTPFFFLNADIGVTNSSGVTSWKDQSGNARNATQGGTLKPTYHASDSDFGGRASIESDDSQKILSVNWDPPAPGTTNIWFFVVLRTVSTVASTQSHVFGGGQFQLALCTASGLDTLRQRNTTALTTSAGAPVGTSARVFTLFSASTSDYLKVGSASTVTGASAGNTDSTNFNLFARSGPGDRWNGKLACIGAWNGDPTTAEKNALDAWVTAYYGSGVAI